MMDYHRRLVRQSGVDSYQTCTFLRTGGDTLITNSSYYEPLVIAITNSFNDIGGDKGVGDRSIYSSAGAAPRTHPSRSRPAGHHPRGGDAPDRG
jgi:hypothetical protein